MKKIIYSVVIVMITLISLSGIYAEVGIIDSDYTENIYKFSDYSDIKLPFIRISSDRMIIDKDVTKSGISFANKSINIENNLKGIQGVFSSDIVRISGELEYGIVIAPTVIIDGVVDKTILVFSDNLTIDKEAIIKEDLICNVDNLNLMGNVEGNLLGVINNANISGNILKDFRVQIDNITLSEETTIGGNVYVKSYNVIEALNKYPNATFEMIDQVEEKNFIDILGIVIISLIFSSLYLLLSTKTNIIKNITNKTKNNMFLVVTAGIGVLLVAPIIFIIVIMLLVLNLVQLALPILAIYIAFIITSFILSTFVVGSLVGEYIINKYTDKVKGKWYKLVVIFTIFFVFGLICNLPIIGYIMSIALCLLSSGILINSIFKK